MRLAASNLSVRLGGHEVLTGVDLEISAGEHLAIVGPNGSGKSTLLRSLAGQQAPQVGSVELDGHPVHRLAPSQRARLLAWLGPDPSHELDFTVEEVVTMGRHPHRLRPDSDPADERRHVSEAMAAADLEDLTDHPLRTLSTGEAQRTALARVLAQQAELVLLDEPTSSLDLGHQSTVMRAFVASTRQRGVALVTALHDLNLAARTADRVGLLSRGRLVAIGAPEEVLEPTLLTDVFSHPVRVAEAGGHRLILPD